MTRALAARLAKALLGAGPILIVLAGSNGAGKSVFHARYLAPLGLPFLNADLIAQRLAPGNPALAAYRAMQVADGIRADLLKRAESFCMETVLSDVVGAKLAFMRQAQRSGFRVLLIHILLDSVGLSQARVHQRVQSGGHSVPDDKLRDRFPRTRRNAQKALRFVDVGLVIDNSSVAAPYRMVEYWEHGKRLARWV